MGVACLGNVVSKGRAMSYDIEREYHAARAGYARQLRKEKRKQKLAKPKTSLGCDLLSYDWSGTTNLRSYALKPTPPTNAGFTGVYTYRRAWRKVRAAIRQLDALWKLTGGEAYLHTWTASPSFARSDADREHHWRRYIDNVRKVWPHMAYLWCTEWHEGGGATNGLKHFHLVTLHAGPIDYRGQIGSMSVRYCGSANGLDIQRIHSTVAYGAKYIAKQARSAAPTESFTRLWACGGLVRSFKCTSSQQSIQHLQRSAPRSRLSGGVVYLCPEAVAKALASEVLRKTGLN